MTVTSTTAQPQPTALTLDRALAVQGLSGDIPSPCVSVCRMDEARAFCVGCSRTLEELRQWRSMDADEKKAVWALIAQRIASVPATAAPSVTSQPTNPEPVTP